MGASYFKTIGLQKQLEEKAKQISQQKTEATTVLEKLDGLIKKANSINFDLRDIADKYKELKTKYDKGEYKETIDGCNELMQLIEVRYKEGYEHISSVINDLTNQYKDIGILKVDKKDAETLWNNGLWYEATVAISEIHNRIISEIKSSVQNIVDQIKGAISEKNESDVVRPNQLIDKIEAYLNEDRISNAIEVLDELYNFAYRDELNQIKNYKDNINNLISIKKEMGDTDGVYELADFSSGKYATPTILLKELYDTYDIIQKEIYSYVKRRLDDLNSKYEMAVHDGIDCELAAMSIKKANQMLLNNDFIGISPQLKTGFKDVRDQVTKRFAIEMEKLKPDMITAKKIGINLDEIIKILEEGRTLLQKEEFSSALEKVNIVRVRLREMLSKVKNIKEQLDEVEGVVSSLKSLGIGIMDTVQLLDESVKAINQANLVLAESLLKKTKDIAWSKAEEKIVSVMEDAQNIEKDAKQLGANTDLITEQIHDLTVLIKEKNIRKAILVARGLKIESKEVLKRYISSLIAEVENSITKNGEHIKSEWMESIQKSKAAFEKGDYSKAVDIVKILKKELEDMYKTRDKDFIEYLAEMIAYTKSINMDTSFFDNSLKQVKEMYARGMYINAHDNGVDLKSKIHKGISRYIGKEFTIAKLAVIEAKKVGVDVSKFKRDLESVQQITEKGDYKNAINVINSVKEEATAARDYNQKAIAEISKAANIISEVKTYGINVQAYIAKLYEAKDYFDKNTYEQSIKVANEIYDECIKSLKEYKVTSKMNGLEEKIREISRYGFDEGHIVAIMNEAHKLIENNDYTGALSTIEWGEQEATQLIKDGFELKISALEKEITNAKNLGIYIGDIEDNVKNARIAMDSGLYSRVMEIIIADENRLRETITEFEMATNELKKAREIINSAEAIRVDVNAAKTTILKINELIRNHMYAEAIQNAEFTIDIVKKQAISYVNTVIVSMNNTIMKAKTTGRNTMLSENLQSRAIASLNKGDYMEAFNYAMRCEGELEKVELQYTTASSSVAMSDAKVTELEKNGFVLKDARALIDKAKVTLMKGDYVSALDYAIQVGDNLNFVIEIAKQAAVMFQNVRERISYVYKIGADVTDITAIFNKAKTAMDKGEYQEVIDVCREATESMTVSINKFIASIEENINDMLAITDKLGVDYSPAKQLYIEAKSSVTTQDFEKVVETLNIAKERLEVILKDRFNTEMQKLRDKSNRLKNEGIEVEEIENEISKISDMIEENKFHELIDLTKSLEYRIDKAEEETIKSNLNMFEKAIIFTENTGVDTTEFMEFLMQYKSNNTARSFDGLLPMIKSSMNKLNETIRDIVKDKLNEFKSDMEMAKMKGIPVADTEKSYALAKTLMDENKVVESYDEISNGFNIITNAYNLKNQIMMLSMLAEETINKARSDNRDVSVAIDMMEKAAKLSSTNYEEAVEILNNISTYIKDNPGPAEVHGNTDKMTESASVVAPPQYTVKTSDGNGQCFYCKGKLKAGMKTTVCNACNTVYHETCANRIHTCIVCSGSISPVNENKNDKK